MRSEFRGHILDVRAVEDCIRVTKKYTKGVFSRSPRHPPAPIQGADFPSKLVTEYYEVYPDMEPSWDMSWPDFWAWVWGDVQHIDMRFQYDYRQDTAKVIIYGGTEVIKELSKGIPGLSAALDRIQAERAEERALAGQGEQVVGGDDRGRPRPAAHPQRSNN